jgi:hypothetical protein
MPNILPKILMYGELFELTSRPLWLCPKGYAAVTHKGAIKRITNNLIILSDEQHIFKKPACTYYKGSIEEIIFFNPEKQEKPSIVTSSNNEKKSNVMGAYELQERRSVPDILHHTHLTHMAKLGLDRAIYGLSQKKKKRDKLALKTAINFRPRYKTLYEKNEHLIKEQSRVLRILDKGILSFPFKYFLSPIGKGDFSRLNQKLDRSLTIESVLDIIRSSNEIPKELQVRNFKLQAAASIVFHSEMVKSYNNPALERDVSSSMFEDQQWDDLIQNQKIKISEVTNSLSEVTQADYFNKALIRCSKRAPARLSKWQEHTFKTLYSLALDLPRHLKLSSRKIDLFDIAYPEQVKKLSIFTLVSITNSAFLTKKYLQLHEVGIKNIGDLVLIHPEVFRFFFRK